MKAWPLSMTLMDDCSLFMAIVMSMPRMPAVRPDGERPSGSCVGLKDMSEWTVRTLLQLELLAALELVRPRHELPEGHGRYLRLDGDVLVDGAQVLL